MALSLEALQVLDAIDRRGSFAAAASELHRVPSAITYSVRQLEQSLGIALFDRDRHRAVLTEAGRELLAEGRRLLRAAADLERRVQQVARGWESELRIAVDTLVDVERLFPWIADFYGEGSGTRIRLGHEVLGGTWDALTTGRADLAVGAPGDLPAGRSFAVQPLGRVTMRFVAAPSHPICGEPQPLGEDAILAHRAVTIADSSRQLPARTVGVLAGQDTLSVASLAAKVAAHVAGLGVGFLPAGIAEREAHAGRLRVLDVRATPPGADLVAAWHPGARGRALQWFVKRLADAGPRLLA